MSRVFRHAVTVFAVVSLSACQSPTEPSDDISVDDYVVTSVSPDPAIAQASHGKTYRVVRGNNQPDDILEFDWETTFTVSVTLNELADDEDGPALTFPVDITSVTAEAKQASGGIVTPPTGAEVEHTDYLITQSSSSRFNAVGDSITISVVVWYDLPNLRKEAFINVSLSMVDSESKTVNKVVKARVAP
jgi:hypothetical protein